MINQLPIGSEKHLQAKGRIQHADPIGEMVHVSAFERLLQQIKVERKSAVYRPPNLLAAIPFIAASYLRKSHAIATPWEPFVGPIFSWQRIYLVDWDGRPLDPANADDARRVFEILPAPDKIGVTAMPAEMSDFLIPQKTPAAASTMPPAPPPGPGTPG